MHVLHTTVNCTRYSHSKEVLLLIASQVHTYTLFPFIPTLDQGESLGINFNKDAMVASWGH